METEKTLNGSLREKARSEILKRINQAATDLLATKSFDEVKMRDVAEAAQISEATLFRHIQGKEDLLMLAFADQIDQVLDSIELKDELDSDDPVDSDEAVDSELKVDSDDIVDCELDDSEDPVDCDESELKVE